MGQPQQPDQAEAEESGAAGPDAGGVTGAGAVTGAGGGLGAEPGMGDGASGPRGGPGARPDSAAHVGTGAATWPAGLAGGVGKPPLRVGMVGYAFMGAAHSQGWRTAGRVFELPLSPVLAAVCGRDGDAVRAMADRHGWAATETDWRDLIA